MARKKPNITNIDLPDLPNLKDLARLTRLPVKLLREIPDIEDIAAVLRDKDQQIRLLSRVVVIMGVFNAIATMPQIYTLYTSQDSGGLSLLSWSYYFGFSVILLLYGVVKKQLPLIATYSLSTIAYAAIVVGIILY